MSEPIIKSPFTIALPPKVVNLLSATVNVPSVNVLPVSDATVNLGVVALLIAKSPLPVNVLSKVAASSTLRVPLIVVILPVSLNFT